MAEQMAIAERFARLAMILGAAQYNENGIAAISQEMVGEILLALKGAQADIDSRANRVEVLMRHRHELLAGLHTARDERDEARAKLKECDDSTDFVQELREAEQATLANAQRLLGVAQTQIDAKDKRIAELEQQLSTCTEKRDKDLDVTVETPAIRVVSFVVLADDFDLGSDIMPTLDNIARRLLMRWIFGGDKIRTEMLGIPEGEPII